MNGSRALFCAAVPNFAESKRKHYRKYQENAHTGTANLLDSDYSQFPARI